MRIGVPKEIKSNENRVGMVPSAVHELVARGHEVYIEHNAGKGIDLSDDDYRAVGARILDTADEVFELADMIVKVKEPQPEECKRLREDQVLFTYLHLAPDARQTSLLQESGCTAIAYETVTSQSGDLPLLKPMSAIAGRLSVQAGAHCLEKYQGGRGKLLGGVPGVLPGKVVVIGGGVVGFQAAKMAIGLEADVTLFERSNTRMENISAYFGNRIKTQFSTKETLAQAVSEADLVIGAVLLPGAAAPKVITHDMLKTMRKGSVFVDVSIDQGGCAETSRVTTYAEPTFIEHGVVHYCVANMPGGVPHTATYALNNATLPYIIALADKGAKNACLSDPHFLAGLNVHKGHITYQAVAEALGLTYTPADIALS